MRRSFTHLGDADDLYSGECQPIGPRAVTGVSGSRPARARDCAKAVLLERLRVRHTNQWTIPLTRGGTRSMIAETKATIALLKGVECDRATSQAG
jgi:hypothetical protein